MAKVVVSVRAHADLKRIWHHIALDDEAAAAADHLLLAIDTKIERLCIFPEIGRRDEIAPGARGLVHDSLICFSMNMTRPAKP